MNRYVIEFRSGSFFRGPRAPWAWFNGAMVMIAPVASR